MSFSFFHLSDFYYILLLKRPKRQERKLMPAGNKKATFSGPEAKEVPGQAGMQGIEIQGRAYEKEIIQA